MENNNGGRRNQRGQNHQENRNKPKKNQQKRWDESFKRAQKVLSEFAAGFYSVTDSNQKWLAKKTQTIIGQFLKPSDFQIGKSTNPSVKKGKKKNRKSDNAVKRQKIRNNVKSQYCFENCEGYSDLQQQVENYTLDCKAINKETDLSKVTIMKQQLSEARKSLKSKQKTFLATENHNCEVNQLISTAIETAGLTVQKDLQEEKEENDPEKDLDG